MLLTDVQYILKRVFGLTIDEAKQLAPDFEQWVAEDSAIARKILGSASLGTVRNSATGFEGYNYANLTRAEDEHLALLYGTDAQHVPFAH